MKVVYLDSSALVKLVVREPESAALRRFLGRREGRVSSALARVEVVRAVRAQGPRAVSRANDVLARVNLIRIDDDLLNDAATLDPGVLRSLDALHLASARALGPDLEGIVTYDERMASAASLLALRVFAPG
jgi:predicted nucleic acid-binding protein